MIDLSNKTNKTHDFIKDDKFINRNDKFANTNWKGLISGEKMKSLFW